MSKLEKLAILGGDKTRKTPWPKWPSANHGTEQLLLDVLHSGRWALSGAYQGTISYERRFANAFAAYHGVRHCVPTTSGTTALTIALLALGIGQGDEVLVPGLTWVACASATFSVGATPILVDIDKGNLAISPEYARAAITDRTRAIMIVHPFCRIADLDQFVTLSRETGIPLIEDCSQAHGALWRGRHVGTFGDVGCFSMQQSKVLTSGEGGAVITNDDLLYEKLQQLRADGRVFSASPQTGRLELVESGSVLGQNFCLSEFQAAILVDRLAYLDEQNAQRETFALELARVLEDADYVQILPVDNRATRYTHYNLALEFDLLQFSGNTIDAIARAMSAELDIQVSPIYAPLNQHPLYNPLTSPRIKRFSDFERFDPRRFSLQNAEAARKRTLTLPNWMMLGGIQGVHDLKAAIEKIRSQSHALCDVEQTKSCDAF